MRVTAELTLTDEVPGRFRTDWAAKKHEVDILVPGDPSDQDALRTVVEALEQVFDLRTIMDSLAEKLREREEDGPGEPVEEPGEPIEELGEPVEPEESGDGGELEAAVDFPPPGANLFKDENPFEG